MFDFLSGKKGKANLERFRSLCDWEKLEIRYYKDCSFVDIREELPKVIKKGFTSKKDVESKKEYLQAYLTKDGLPLKIDRIWAIPTETYLIWQSGRIVEAFEFRLGYFAGKKFSDPEIKHSWYYEYDSKGRISQMRYIDHKDKVQYGYYWSPYETVLHRRYEYDNNGLSKTYQRYGLPSKIEKAKEVIIYDREREKFLSTCTVTKSAYISKPRKPKKQLLFKRGYYTTESKKEAPICQKCGKPKTYIGYVDLEDPRIKTKPLLKKIPVFYCFDCFEDESSTINLKTKAQFTEVKGENVILFPEGEIDFVKSSDGEENPKALFKVGGLPDWIQDEVHPLCPECHKNMIFVCQINTDESISNGKDVQAFGDSGKLYVFTCCNSITNIMQCY
jgi:hypothetical protein